MAPKRPALFLDRDGVINQEVGYLIEPADVRWVEGIFALCRQAMLLDYRIVVVTNQSGIGRGFYTTQQFEDLMRWMRAQLQREQVVLDAVYHCPYHPEHGEGSWRREHEDRKPHPGMLLRAARELHLDLSRSVLVGDRCTDIAAANAAGLRKAFLLTGTEQGRCQEPHIEVTALEAVAAWLRRSAAGFDPDRTPGKKES